eukprot:scaffold381251_cov27-Prasinocladus_malaysianus.AAC.1
MKSGCWHLGVVFKLLSDRLAPYCSVQAQNAEFQVNSYTSVEHRTRNTGAAGLHETACDGHSMQCCLSILQPAHHHVCCLTIHNVHLADRGAPAAVHITGDKL